MFTLAKTIFLTTFSTNAPILRDIEKEIGRTQHMQIILILLHILKRVQWQSSNNDFSFFGLEKNSKMRSHSLQSYAWQFVGLLRLLSSSSNYPLKLISRLEIP